MAVIVRNFSRSPRAGGKFVVLRRRDDPDEGIAAFSDFTLDTQHADIVRRLGSAMGMSPAESGWRVDGGGWWKLEDGRILRLYGRSAAYGVYDSAWLRGALRAGTVMGEQTVLLE
ncbi:MAG: hypothetical protein LBJ46_02975 [Planctomycetota bacterium]|jgi:hypothetical protein|nr:hypothetical protein [Planctomycetota bacterium]